MAEKVTIDIPGIGKVEAENAASEATLKKLLDAINKNQKTNSKPGAPGGGSGDGTSGRGGGGGGGGGRAGGGGGGAAASNASASKSAKALNALGAASAGAGYALGTAAKAGKFAGGSLVSLAEGSANLIGKFAAVGDDLNAAAGIFSGIPILGPMFSAVASAVESTIKAYSDASGAGASFGGSLNSFSAAASSAGMSMQDFGSMIRQNGQGMLGFGVTTESGAQNFAKVSRQLRATSGELYALGYNSKDINQGLANYGAIVKSQGLQGTKTNAELARGAKSYLKEMDALAKITGEERSAKEAQAKALLTDAQFQMAMAGKDEMVRKDFNNLILGFGPKLGGFVKDFVATGSLTTEANQKLGAMLGGDVMNEMTKLRSKMQNNQRLTDEEQDRLKSIMQKAAVAQSKLAGTSLAASRDMDDASGGMIEAIGLNQGAHKASAADQDKAAKSTDGMNKTVNDAKASLAEFSNAFSMALINSGLLNTLLVAFKFTANFMMTYVVPLFSVLASSVGAVVNSFLTSFGPAINGAGGFFNGVLIPAIKAFTNFLVVDLIPAVAKTFNDLKPTLIFLGGIIMTVAKFITDNLTTVLVVVGGALLAYYAILAVITVANFLEAASKVTLLAATGGLIIATLVLAAKFIIGAAAIAIGALAAAAALALIFWPVTLAVAAVTALVVIFKKFGGDVSVVKDGLLIMWDGFKMFFNYLKLGFLKLLDYIPGVDMDEEIKQTEADIAQNKKDASDRADAIQATMAKNRAAAEAEKLAEEKREREEAERKRKAEEAKNKPTPSMPGSTGFGGGMGGGGGGGPEGSASGTSSASAIPGMDYNLSGDDALKAFAAREGSSFVPAKPVEPKSPQGTQQAQADAARKQIEADATKKQQEAAAANAKAEEDRKKQQEQKPQENPSVLLAELNNKMAQMIKLQSQTTTNTYENVLATKGLNNNLYKA
jgi:hypothetical protein